MRPELTRLYNGYFDAHDNVSRWSKGTTKTLEQILNDVFSYIARSEKVLTVDQDGHGDFRSINAALDSFDDESATKRYSIVPSPGTYQESVKLRQFTSLVSPLGFGPARNVVVTSSGKTVSMTHSDCLVQGIAAVSTSGTSTDAAIRVDQSPSTVETQSFIVNTQAISTAGARSLDIQPLPPMAEVPVLIYAGADALGGGESIVCDAAGIIFFLGGGGGSGAAIGLKLRNGSFAMIGAEVGLSADPAAGIVVDADASFFVALSMRFDDGFTGIKLRNGSVGFLVGARSLGGLPGVPIDTDPTSIIVIGNVAINALGSAPWAGWSVLGPSLLLWTGSYGFGTTGVGGPDQRPSGVPIGYQFFALDISPGGAAGPGCLLVWNGGGWVDTSGAVIP